MQAIILEQGYYNFNKCPLPLCTPDHVLIKVAYAGVNRADLLQKQGRYPLPECSPAIPGMEVSGEIVECGNTVAPFKKGAKVCALVSEGGYGEYVLAHQALVLPVPEGISLESAAGLPEACFTVWISLVWQAKLKAGETLLIHGGSSGIGSIAIQIGRLLGARVFTTSGSDEKCMVCEQCGAVKAINYRKADYVSIIKEQTANQGVDVILDMVGGDYFQRNLECLNKEGRLCIIAFLQGSKMPVNLSPILFKHLSVMGSTLRARPLQEKAQIASELYKNVWKAIEKGLVKPVIDQIFPLCDAEKALLRMEEGLNVGKILLRI